MKNTGFNLKGLFIKPQDAHTPRKIDKRKAIFILVAVLLLCTLCLLYVFQDTLIGRPEQATKTGINSSLPDAVLKKDAHEDKMSIYSITPMDSPGQQMPKMDYSINSARDDAQAKAITEKLSAINEKINAPIPLKASDGLNKVNRPGTSVEMGNDIDRLEILMKNVQNGYGEDKEMEQLGEMMDKIISIQNPGVLQQKMLNEKLQQMKKDSAFHAIPAVIDGQQRVIQGSLVRLRLLDTVTLQHLLLPKGQLLFGSCSIVNQRLLLNIENIRLGSSIIPVNLSVFSLDGILGIDAPEAVISDAASNGAANAINSMQFLSMDSSLGLQAAGAGIDAAKSLIGRKVRRIKIKLKAGYPVLLRINKY